MPVKLSDIIAPVYWPVWQDIKEGKHTDYWFRGGRSSAKSSAISIFLPLGIMADPEANAMVLRKVGDTLRSSVYEQILWGIEKLGVSSYFECKTSPLEITYKPTGQKIVFRGVDKPEKIKSVKIAKGYFKFAWFEELAEFNGMEEVDNVILSLLRGGNKSQFVHFFSYNPPAQASSWVNVEANTPKEDRLVITSSYLDLPKGWLPEAFLLKAEHKRITDPRYYEHVYLGKATGTGGAIFPNAKSFKMDDEMIAQFDNVRQGVDWGFVADPFCFIKLHYDKTRSSLYIFDEIYEHGLSNKKAIAKVADKADPIVPIYADSAEPKSIREFKDSGIYMKSADKGSGSVEYGIKFLQGLDNIYIDPDRCPNTWKEFSMYELEKDKNGEWKNEPPDKNNHAIDAARYGLCKDSLSGDW